jgi:hypothetical protein
MSLFEFVLMTLAVWRLTYLVTSETGPGDIFLNIRLWTERHSKFLSDLLSCVYCTSIWVSLGFTVLFFVDLRQAIVLSLALSGASILVEEIRRRIDN